MNLLKVIVFIFALVCTSSAKTIGNRSEEIATDILEADILKLADEIETFNGLMSGELRWLFVEILA